MLRQVFAFLAICLFFLSFVDAFQIDSKDFTVDVTADSYGRPEWLFWKNDNATYVYALTFQYFFEIENLTSTSFNLVSNSKFDNTNGWALSSQAGTNVTAVNWTNAGVTGMKYNNFDSIAFNTRVPLGVVANTNDTFPAGKFDIAVNGYKWTSATSQLAFVFSFVVQSSAGAPMENFTSHGSHTANLLDSYFSINSTANGGVGLNDTIDVTLKFATAFTQNTTAVNSTDIWVIFDHFDDDIYHDPEFGFGAGPGNSYIWIIIIVVVVIAIIVIILIAVIGFILVRRKRRSYDAF